MNVTPASATNPFHIARAYALRDAGAGTAQTRTQATPGADRLVAAGVPGGVDFSLRSTAAPGGSGGAPVGAGLDGAGPLALYRHPADRNGAATGVAAGRVLDVKA